MAKNVFFDIAVKKASGILGKKGRLVMLISQLALKLRSVNWKSVKASEVKENFFTLGRLLKAYALGHYREIPWKPLLLITAAVIYFINPIDFVPDWIPGAGLTDDVGIVMSVFSSFGAEIDKFLTWEKSRLYTA
ncbi:YkvA family protein [Ohtaekwangia sp.]|uniref:YkvA family protein n=1 Tax=Ohtaekwangia sp. TaxID=2066019 RepID=UPI002F92FEF6